MTEVLLGGLLVEWAKAEFPHANFTSVEAPAIELHEDQFGMPIMRVGEGHATLVRASRLKGDDLQKFNRIEAAYDIAFADVEILLDGKSKTLQALFSNGSPHKRDITAPDILQAVLNAKSHKLARAIVIGAGYRFAAFDLAKNEERVLEFTHRGQGSDLPEQKMQALNMGFYELVRMSYRHKRFNGEVSGELHREVLIAGDAVIVLPYDPVLDKVVLIEQLRPAALGRRSYDAWELEAVAGVIGHGEEPTETAMRELEEEAGLKATALYPIPPSYQSPGTLTQFMYPFIARVDLSDYRPGLFGLETEDEDIRSHLMTRAQAINLLRTGEANNAPLQIVLYELALNFQEISAHLLADQSIAT